MPWKADQIYSKANPELMAFLQNAPDFSGEIFCVKDLKGIRSEWTQQQFSNPNSKIKHTMPEDGLLVIKPIIYETGYDKDEDSVSFWKQYRKAHSKDKWAFIESFVEEEFSLPVMIEMTSHQKKLLTFLKSLNERFDVPLMYYFCEMWGGDIDVEYVIVLDKIPQIYMYDVKTKQDMMWMEERFYVLNTSILQKGLEALSLSLPTGFFALHECSFDWKRYQC